MLAATLAATLAGTLAGTTAPAGAAASGDGWTGVSVTTLVSGLDDPRGVVFDGRGALYVAESGRPLPGPTGTTLTGRVSKYAPAAWSRAVWTTRFTSLHDSENGQPEALGPEGLSALPSTCTVRGGPCAVKMIMSESQVGTADAGSPRDMGMLLSLDGPTGQTHAVSNVGDQQWAWTDDHKDLFPSDFPDSNPYGLLVSFRGGRYRTYVADAGANTISEVLPSGRTKVISYIPNETTGARRDATPTCIAQGPDGALYVGTLDLLSNFGAGGGQANVYRVDPDTTEPVLQSAHLWASGLTTVSSCTFDRQGNFWATELFGQHAAPSPTAGDLVVMPFAHPAQQTHLGEGTVVLPGGIAQGPDGAMYVTTGAAAPAGAGGVVRVVPTR